MLTQPGRLQKVISHYAEHFQLEPFPAAQVATLADIPQKPVVTDQPGGKKALADGRTSPRSSSRPRSDERDSTSPTMPSEVAPPRERAGAKARRKPRPDARPHPARHRRLRARLSACIVGRLVMFGI